VKTFACSVPRAFAAARSGDWYEAEAILLAGIFALLGVNERKALR
jgi:hypothetical protein